MKKILAYIVAVTFFISSCGSSPTPEVVSSTPIPTSDSSQSIEAAAGSEFTIVLSSNPTTGYHWELIGEPDASVVQFISKDYKPDEPISVGSGGVDVLTFHALAAGTAQITLGYYPPSNDPVEPQQTVTFNVIVK